MKYSNYARQHLKVFACRKDKTPATANGFHDATDSEQILYYQFRENDHAKEERYLIGLPCGAVNGIVVVDFDLYKTELDIDEIKTIAGQEFPETLSVQTQSGGIHYYYKIDKEKGTVPNITKAFGKALPVDIRGDGGYIIAPDGIYYVPVDAEIENLRNDFISHLTPAPDWLYNYRKPQDLNVPILLDSISDSEYVEIQSALKTLSSDDRDRWVSFGIALKNTGSERAFDLWDEWSKKSEKYDADDQKKRWDTFKPTGDITIASIFSLAQKTGWTSTYKTVNEIDLDQIDERKNHEKAPFPKQLLNPPGLVGELIEHINKFSKKPQPILALAGALSAAGAIMGQRFQTDQGLRTNLYILGVGESGSGKEAARSAIKKLFEAANIGEWSATEDLASDAAILTTLEKSPSQVFLLDEIGRFLKTTNQASSKNAHLYNVISVLLKIYGSANQTYRGKAYADAEKQKKIESPNLCIYGTTVPRTLFEGLTVENITDGFLSRFMIFESEDPNPEPSGRRKIAMQTVCSGLVKKVKSIVAVSRCPNASGDIEKMEKVDPMIVTMDGEAISLLDQYEKHIYNHRETLRKEDRIDTTYNRSAQFAEQIALIIAVGRDHVKPVITNEDALYAVELVDYLSNRVHHIAEHFIARNEHEHEGKRILNIIRVAGKKGITSSQLTRKTQNLKQFERNDLLSTLEDSDLIISAMDGKTKRYYPKKITHIMEYDK